MIEHPKKVRLFQNPVLESLTKVHPAIPIVVWTPIIVFLFFRSIHAAVFSTSAVLMMAVSGLAFWTFAEYVLHRYAFHFHPRTAIQARLVFLFHGNHHEAPQDPMRLLMPPFAGVMIAAPFYLSFVALFGDVLGEAFTAGFLIGYLCYDYIHYLNHHYIPKTNFGRMVKQRHMYHHYVSHETNYGVSSPIWDYVFGTVGGRGKNKKPHSDNSVGLSKPV